MNALRHLLLPLLLILLTGSCYRQASGNLTAVAEPEPFTFTILQLNDVYEIAPLEGGRVGGLARVGGLLRQLEQEDPHTIAVMAGDFLSPSFMSNLKLDDGRPIAGLQMVETLNAMGLDYATFGNHEFDLKDSVILRERLDASTFTYLSSNARRRTGDGGVPFTQDGQPVPDYAVHTFRNEDGRQLRVALVGTVLPFNEQEYVTYLPVEQAFRRAVNEARAEADLVLGLTHLSIDGDMALAAAVPGLPLLMGGHEHEHLSRWVVSSAITKADANAKTVYVHRFTFYPQSNTTELRSELVAVTAELPEHPATRAVVDRWQQRVTDLVGKMGYDPDRVLMHTDVPLEGKEAVVRNRQTNYGQLALQAVEAAWPGADAYLINSGSLRLDDNLQGAVTEYDVLRSFPFGGPVVMTSLSGEELQRVMQAGTLTNKGEGGYLQYRGVGPAEDGGWQVGGKPLQPEQSYTVVWPEFVAKGREAHLDFVGSLPFKRADELRMGKQSVRNDIRDLLIAYMAMQQ